MYIYDSLAILVAENRYDILLFVASFSSYSGYFVTGKTLWAHVDGSTPAPNKDPHKVEHAK